MSLGFIIIRHVNNEKTDNYWKECYNCIRKFYNNPIIIIDDSSDKNFLKEDINVVNCTTIYDINNKGCGEILPYYYFYKFHPFDNAIIIHDSVFVNKYINFYLNKDENVRILWSFYHYWDNELLNYITDIVNNFNEKDKLLKLFQNKNEWLGCFGSMSIIRWDFLKSLQDKYKIFDTILNIVKSRIYRSSLERVLGLLFCCENNCKNMFGNIHNYIREGTTFEQYKDGLCNNLDIIKVWTGR